MKRILYLFLPVSLLTFSLINSSSIRVSASYTPEYYEVDLEYLAFHMQDFLGIKVRTMGTVKYLISFYMYEDFWLVALTRKAIPVVVRFAGLPQPPEDSVIEVLGIIEHCDLEGGFYYLNASSWIYSGTFYDFTVGDRNQHVAVISNSMISGFVYSEGMISFNVSGLDGTRGFCKICVPTSLLNGTYKILINGIEVPHTLLPCLNNAHSCLRFSYDHSTKGVVIIPEFPSFIILSPVMIATLPVIVFRRKTFLDRL